MSRLIYRERVLPGPGTLLLPLVIGFLLYATLLPLDSSAALCLSAGLVVAAEGLLVFRAPVIEVSDKVLRVGRANIERKFLGKVSIIDPEESFSERGHKLDARAYTCFQGSVRTMVKLELNDLNDPCPYWLFSTRQAESLVSLLG